MASFDLPRFVEAQDPLYDDVRAELTAGTKASHWTWFVFPQFQSLGRSSLAIMYGIASEEEARAYWQYPIFGPRLKECVELVLSVKGRNAFQIFGTPDDLKFRSSIILFSLAVPGEPMFERALGRYFDGRADPRTMELLARSLAVHDRGRCAGYTVLSTVSDWLQCSVSCRSPVPAFLQSTCVTWVAGHPLFVWAGNRRKTAFGHLLYVNGIAVGKSNYV